jgi:hypothetical protein
MIPFLIAGRWVPRGFAGPAHGNLPTSAGHSLQSTGINSSKLSAPNHAEKVGDTRELWWERTPLACHPFVTKLKTRTEWHNSDDRVDDERQNETHYEKSNPERDNAEM